MMTDTLETPTSVARVGIIGMGARGVRCFGALLKEQAAVEIAALADPNEQRLKIAQSKLDGVPEIYTDVNTMLQEARLDGVVITTPDYTHATMACAALRAGVRNVLIEKPMATTAQGCVDIIDAMRETGGRVAIGFNLRFVPLLARIKEIVANGETGELMMGEIREFVSGGKTYMSRWNRKYELSGGLWIHKGSHDFDIFNWWNEEGTPTRVFASAGLNCFRPDKIPFEVEKDKPVGPTCATCAYYDICPDRHEQGKTDLFNATTATDDGYYRDLCVYTSDKEVHDNGIAIVEYDNNVRISQMECFACGFSDRIYTLVGDRGTLEASLSNPTQILFRPRWGEDRIIDVSQPRAGGHGGADPVLAEDLVSMMRGEPFHLSAVKAGIHAVAVGQAAEISWRENRAVDIAELVDLDDPKFNGAEPTAM